jgi:hypothetical protein
MEANVHLNDHQRPTIIPALSQFNPVPTYIHFTIILSPPFGIQVTFPCELF